MSLFATPIKDIIPKDQQLVVIDAKTHVMEALKILSKHNIYSAPVLDKEKNIYYGFLDALDVVMFVLSVMSAEDRSGKLSISFEENIQKYGRDLAKNVADLSATNPMIPMRATDSVLEALKVFAESGTHRVPILEGESVAKIGNVLTQTAVIAWLANHTKELAPIVKKRLSDCNVQLKPVISVELGATAYQAFKLMSDNRVNAVAVVNADGTILSSLSAKDIREVNLDQLAATLNGSCIELVQKIRNKQINVSYPSFHCHLHNTLEEILHKVAVLRVHRLYIVNDEMKPIGVLSLSDIFNLLLH